jgi:RND family efflux transporter MFP subunit
LYFSQTLLAASPTAVPVVVSPVQQQDIIRSVQLTGTVTSAQVATLSPSISGLITAVHIEEGDRVVAGSPLLQLDDELSNWQWQSATAKVAQTNNALQDAQRRLLEARTLGRQRGIAESTIKGLESEVHQDEALLQQMIAEAGYQQALLKRHQLNAPFNGVVSKKLVEQGEWINPGSGVLELVATDNLRLDFTVTEDYLATIEIGNPVSFKLNAQPGSLLQGRVETIVPVLDPTARTFLLRVRLDQQHSSLSPGLSVQAKLQIASGRRGLVVPKDALLRYPDGRIMLWTVTDQNGKLIVEQQPVITGLALDNQIEIRSGLSADDRVVIKGNEALQQGQTVYITNTLQQAD